MAKIFRKSDRIKVKIGTGEEGLTLSLAPLSQHLKVEIQALFIRASAAKNPKLNNEGLMLALKNSIKAMEGVTDQNDEPYQLEFVDGVLSDECLDDLMNMSMADKLMFVAGNMVNGVPSQIIDENGKPVVDVEILEASKPKKEAQTFSFSL